MKEIKLTQGKVALVDDEDFDYLNQWKWYFDRFEHSGYAGRNNSTFPYRVKIHHVIADRHGWIRDGRQIDHIDGNGLNNCSSNLRIVTLAQNQYNQKLSKNNKSGFKGVYWDREFGKWRANIRFNGKLKHLGRFDDPIEAAKAYNDAALEYFGEFARLNPV
jgi:hypothetical protein